MELTRAHNIAAIVGLDSNNGDSEDQFVVEDTDDVSIYSLYSICTSTTQL